MFRPLAAEAFGGWFPQAREDIKRLAAQLASRLGQAESIIQSHFRQRISILLQKGNVGLLTSRIPTHPEGHVDADPDFEITVPDSPLVNST